MRHDSSPATIAALILTKNEERHIVRCISSLQGVCDEIVVVDSFSDDGTVELAVGLGARVVQHPWTNYATQFNFGVYECGIASEWIWRIDADEYLDGGLGAAVRRTVSSCGDGVSGVYVRRRIDFMGRPLLHGGWYPSYHLKVFRRGHGECESRWMDEHIRLFDGTAVMVDEGAQVDANLNDLSWWTSKHNGYATREMADLLLTEYGLDASSREISPQLFGTEEQRKRWLKVRYAKAPLFLRPFLNFLFRYFLRLGFLDGREGFVWHVLQGFWYRMLVDAKIFEAKKRLGWDESAIRKEIAERYSPQSGLGGVSHSTSGLTGLARPLSAGRRSRAA